MDESPHTRTIAILEIVTAVGLIAYWLLFFTVGLAPENAPPGYFVFQHSFTGPDVILSLCFIMAATMLLGPDAVRRKTGRALSLVCAGSLLFLGLLDISFNLLNGIYGVVSLDMLTEVGVNLWCMGFGGFITHQFGFKYP